MTTSWSKDSNSIHYILLFSALPHLIKLYIQYPFVWLIKRKYKGCLWPSHRNSESQSVINHTGFSFLNDQKTLPRCCHQSTCVSEWERSPHICTNLHWTAKWEINFYSAKWLIFGNCLFMQHNLAHSTYRIIEF